MKNFFIISMLSLAACSASKNQDEVFHNKMLSFEEGKTTRKEVERKVGRAKYVFGRSLEESAWLYYRKMPEGQEVAYCLVFDLITLNGKQRQMIEDSSKDILRKVRCYYPTTDFSSDGEKCTKRYWISSE